MPEATQTIQSAETLSVGTELLLGEIVDTNSAYLASELAKRGVDVYWSVRVGDNHGRIVAALTAALSRSDLVVVCGGLGPTDDDLTRHAVAAVVGEEQYLDAELKQWLEERFARSGRPMPERNLQQAMMIQSATALANPIGTAPGWLVTVPAGGRERYIVTLPGPPRELEMMWREQAVPRLAFPASRLFVRNFKTLGVGESLVAERLGDLTKMANPSVATYAKRDGVHVRVAAKADDEQRARSLAAPVVERVAELLGQSVWGFDDDELADVAVRRLLDQGRSLAVAEGMSGGLISDLLNQSLTQLSGGPGAPVGARALAGSVVAWQPESMRTHPLADDLLKRLPAGLPAGAAEVVAAMAAAVRALFAADIGIAVGYPLWLQQLPTGAAVVGGAQGPGTGPDLDKSGRARIVIAMTAESGTTVETLDMPPLGRAWIRERSAFSSLHLLIRSALS